MSQEVSKPQTAATGRAQGDAYSSFTLLQMRESKIRNSSESGNVKGDVSFKGRHYLSQSSCNYEMSTWEKKKDRWNEDVALKVVLKKNLRLIIFDLKLPAFVIYLPSLQ